MSIIISVILLLSLAIFGRGGFQQIPVNQSDVYFSSKIFANHAAVNLPWNFLHSVLRKDFNTNNPYTFMADNKAKSLVDSLYNNKPSSFSESILNTKKPNIIFIILESYTSKFIGCLGGQKGVTPNIDKIAAEGMLFNNIYASGDRSEKGLVALLSGYPTQTVTSIVKTPTKTEKLPQLSTTLKKQGYNTSYYYGGELAFANIKSYLLNGSYDRLISKGDFDSKFYNSKWGVHDDVLLKRFLSDLNKEKRPFFANLFTLSSHEPYKVPFEKHFAGDDETSLFKNSFAYTDQAIGAFITQAKQQSWWDSTLIIMVADHGHRLPYFDANDNPEKFKIPLLFSGGALKQKGVVINTIGSQTDIGYTLLRQLNIENSGWKWSKDLLDLKANQFAFYIFNDGFGIVTPKGAVTFDNVAKKEIYRSGKIDSSQLLSGKAYMQQSFKDFLRR
ncbi:MAG: LTA synthase family protein [Ginsengibacter sp.]